MGKALKIWGWVRSGKPDHWLERNDFLQETICGVSGVVADDPNLCEEFRSVMASYRLSITYRTAHALEWHSVGVER